MLEPPSDELLQRLRDWQLCQPRDVRSARRLVRQLARDLPAFDSVWIDALVRLGRLTPYQARVLESDAPEELRLGEVLLLDEIGRSQRGRTWLAYHLVRRERCVLKRVSASPERQGAVIDRGRRLVEAARGCASPHLVAPTSCWEDRHGCCFVSRDVAGVPLSELLVRRGRFPAAIVGELARQLALGLAAWHELGLVHGDVRLSHIRIDAAGHAVLVEAGLRPIVEPEITLHASLSLEAYDGVAPELIGVGQTPSVASDLYALGCLLWQLLAGRPPFAVADPLAKLAAHQTRTIEDVREWAPETPEPLADLIAQLVQRKPEHRPSSAVEVLSWTGRLSLPGRSGVRRFRQAFDLAVPHLRQTTVRGVIGWPAAAIATAVVVAAVMLGADRNARTELLSLGAQWLGRQESTSDSSPRVIVDAHSGLKPLPQPAADGTLLLTDAGPFAVAEIQFAGQLQIRAASGVCPEIVVRDQPLQLACESLRIEGVNIRRDSLWLSAEPPKALALVHAQQIVMHGCRWDTGDPNPRRRDQSPPIGLAWRLVEPLDTQAGQLTIRHSVFQGQGTAIFASDAARKVTAENVLRVGAGPCLELARGDEAPAPMLHLSHVTLRDCRALIRFRSSGLAAGQPALHVTTTDCVFGLRTTNAALLEIDTPDPPQLHANMLTWNGESSLVPADTAIVVWSRGGEEAMPVSTDEAAIDGLIAGRFAFVGPPTMSVADSVLGETDIPRRSLDPPGIQLQQFPVCLGGDPVADDDISLELTLPTPSD